jgi:hypothetical protein
MAENLIPVSMARQAYILTSRWPGSQPNGVGGHVMEMSGISVPGAGMFTSLAQGRLQKTYPMEA